MNLLSRYLKFSAVRLDLDIASQKRLFEEASFALQGAYGVPHDAVFTALSERERIGSTALGHGCAVPHGRLAQLSAPAVAFLRTVKPLKLPSPDGTGAQLFIVILAPDGDPDRHLVLLREAARLFSNDAMREKLLQADSPTTFCECITGWTPPEEPPAPTETEDQDEAPVPEEATIPAGREESDEDDHTVAAPDGTRIFPEGE